MSEAVKCDNEDCGKFFLVMDDDSDKMVHMAIHNEEAFDFCSVDCAFHFLSVRHLDIVCLREISEAKPQNTVTPGEFERWKKQASNVAERQHLYIPHSEYSPTSA